MIKRLRCLLCAGPLLPLDAVSTFRPDVDGPAATLHYGACTSCQFAMSTELPDDAALARYYAQNSQLRRERMTAAESFHLHKQLGFLLPHLQAGAQRCLEIGPDMGHFLRLLSHQLQGQTLQFSEFNLQARQHLEAAGFASWDGQPMNAIVVRHVLEHVGSPVEFLHSMRQALVAGGRLFIEVPDYSVLDPELCDPFQAEHLSYFSLRSLLLLAERTGFEVCAAQTDRTPGYSTSAGRVLRVVLGRLADRVLGQDWNTVAVGSAGRYSRIADRISTLAAQGRRVALYGAGTFSRQLAELHDLQGRLMAVYDSDPKKVGQRLFGLPVLPADQLHAGACDVLVLTVFGYEDEVQAFVRSRGFDSARLVSAAAGS